MTNNKHVALWLFVSATAVFLMALIGAVTRLTESGLSIVEWKPVAGALPPLNAAGWEREFDLYKQSPQYLKVNHGMTLAEFKQIYFWEWVHRLWGRMIGLIYLVPFILFWAYKKIPTGKLAPLTGILALGFLQGAMGWYMVKSGLVDMPAVSHYRLAAHLMLAFLIFSLLFRQGLSFSLPPEPDAGKLFPLRGMIKGTLVLAGLTMVWGAFTAGLDGGLLYNTFPKMDDHWVPPELFQHESWSMLMWRTFLEDPAVVQFIHRLLAILVFCKIMLLYRRSRAFHCPPRLKKIFAGLLLMGIVQPVLGIATLLTQVDIILATAHQAGAMALLALLVWLLHEIPAVQQEK